MHLIRIVIFFQDEGYGYQKKEKVQFKKYNKNFETTYEDGFAIE